MCGLHAQRWERAGRPDLDAWLAQPQPFKRPAAGAVCRIPHCELWPQGTSPFCQTHTNTWKVNGRPDIDEFADGFAAETPLAGEMIRLDRLTGQLKLEMQYVLQRRHDDRQGKLTPDVVMRVVRALADANVGSLLDHGEDAWRERTQLPINDSCARGFLGYACRVIADLADAGGWEAEYPRDVWRMRRLGYNGDRTLRFTGIDQPWLRDLAKRWVRWRLSSGLGLEAGGGRPVVVLTRFAGFLAAIGVERIDQVDRLVLERYLADLRGDSLHAQRRGAHIGLLNRFFATVRQHRWNTALPADATFFTEDYPKREERLPRALAEHVMAQLEDPGNLARFADPAHRLITIILMRCGLRITDALQLRSDCVVSDAEGAPYLRYRNHKMKREALVPIDEQVRELIAEHRSHTAQRWPAGTPGLFPRPTKNIDGAHPIGNPTYRMALLRWLSVCDVRDEHRQASAPDPAPVASHPGHPADKPRRSPRGRATHPRPRLRSDDRALRPAARHHRAPPVGVGPEGRHPRATVTFDPSGPIAEAPGPNSASAGPPRHCPMATAGYRCAELPARQRVSDLPMFLTTSEFLPQHHQQQQQTLS